MEQELQPTPETEPRLEPKVWIGCLAAYNEGHLHGKWVDAARDVDELWADVFTIVRSSPALFAEEHFIADHEGFGAIRIGEYEPMERVAALAKLVQEHGEPFGVWLSWSGEDDLDQASEKFSESYIGHFDDENALEQHIMEEQCLEPILDEALKDVPGWMHTYVEFDIEAYVRDLQFNGDLYIAQSVKSGIDAFYAR